MIYLAKTNSLFTINQRWALASFQLSTQHTWNLRQTLSSTWMYFLQFIICRAMWAHVTAKQSEKWNFCIFISQKHKIFWDFTHYGGSTGDYINVPNGLVHNPQFSHHQLLLWVWGTSCMLLASVLLMFLPYGHSCPKESPCQWWSLWYSLWETVCNIFTKCFPMLRKKKILQYSHSTKHHWITFISHSRVANGCLTFNWQPRAGL